MIVADRQKNPGSYLERLTLRYQSESWIDSDPLRFPLRYTESPDREIVALVAALFAYGNVKAIQSFLEHLLDKLGPSPAKTLAAGRIPDSPLLYYRFQQKEIVQLFLQSLASPARIALDSGSAFDGPGRSSETQAPEPPDHPWGEGAKLRSRIIFLKNLLLKKAEEIDSKRAKSHGFIQLISGNLNASGAAKRYCLFFRWMVRTGFPDMGIYKTLQPAELVVPLDVHLHRESLRLKFTERKSTDWKTALEITRSLKKIDPEDPLRFDFPLTRPGITGQGPSPERRRTRKS